MNVVGVQMDITWENRGENHRRVRDMLRRSRGRSSDSSLVVLPEMFATGFSMNVAGISDDDGQTARFMSETASEMGSYLLGGVVRSSPDRRGRNEAAVFSPQGAEMARYQKIHPFTLGTESQHYERGSKVVMFDAGGFRACPFICYDLRFPEIFRAAARQGADLFIVIANWPFPRDGHWVTLLQARAIENLAYVVGVNRVGRDPKLTYPGRSMIIDPRGKVLADAGGAEGLIHAELRPEEVAEWRKAFPALQDVHPSFAGG